MELAEGDEDGVAGTEDFGANFRRGCDFAGGQGAVGHSKGFVVDGVEAGAVVQEMGKVDLAVLAGSAGFGADGSEKGFVEEDVGEDPEGQFVGVDICAER